ncbi:MAG: hypothetical protein ACE5PT_05440 [Gemmatimonadales bacterium]
MVVHNTARGARKLTALVALVGASATTGCFVADLLGSDDVIAGDYELVSVNEQDIPAVVSEVQYLGGSLTMREGGSFSQVLLLQLGEIGVTTVIDGGYTLDGSTVLFVIASITVNGEQQTSETGSINGTWDGDEIRIADEQIRLVFRK